MFKLIVDNKYQCAVSSMVRNMQMNQLIFILEDTIIQQHYQNSIIPLSIK